MALSCLKGRLLGLLTDQAPLHSSSNFLISAAPWRLCSAHILNPFLIASENTQPSPFTSYKLKLLRAFTGDTPSSFSGHRTTSHPPASPPLTESLKLPKNRSTGNLLAQAATAQRENKPRIRFSFDGASQAEMEALSK